MGGKFSQGQLGGPVRRHDHGKYTERWTARPVHPSEGRLKPGPDLFPCLVCVFAVMLAATLWKECV